MVTDTFLVSLNRYDSLCIHSEGVVSTEESRVENPKHIRKHKVDSKKRVFEKKQRNVIILGDSNARGCAAKVSHLLNDYLNSGLLIQAQE
jgi:hypothetical protein